MTTNNRTIDDLIKAPTWCPSPWFEMYIEPNGDVMICCESDTFDNPAGNIHTSDLRSIQQSEQFRQARETMMADKWPRLCHYCKVKEERFGASSRTGRLHGYRDLLHKYQENFTTLHPNKIFKLKIDFSNGCNLRCSMCSEHRSTSWIKDKKRMLVDFDYWLNDSGFDYGHFHNSMEDWHVKKITSSVPRNFVDDNIDFLLDLHHIEVSGGEPFYHTEFLYLLEKLRDAGWNRELKIITNLTLLTEEIAETLSHFNTKLILSLDACGDLYEYIRPSVPFGKYNWDHQHSRLMMALDYGIKINFAYTVQLLNFYNLEPWMEFYHSTYHLHKAPNMFNNNSLVNPPHLTINNHPDMAEKKRLVSILEKDERVHPQNINAILEPPKEKGFEAFCRFVEFTDGIRKCNIFDYIPELEKYWIDNPSVPNI